MIKMLKINEHYIFTCGNEEEIKGALLEMDDYFLRILTDADDEEIIIRWASIYKFTKINRVIN